MRSTSTGRPQSTPAVGAPAVVQSLDAGLEGCRFVRVGQNGFEPHEGARMGNRIVIATPTKTGTGHYEELDGRVIVNDQQLRFERSDLSWVLCLECAALFKPAQSGTYQCPNCGNKFSLRTLLNRTKLASDAVRFGYQYRIVYEEHLEEEGPWKHHTLPLLPEIVEWVVLAAISGMIGGASWDLAKHVVAKLRTQIATEPELRELDQAKLILNDEEFGKLLVYVADFLKGMENVAPEVRAAIIDEMIMERAVELMGRGEGATESTSPVAGAIEELNKENLLDQAEFEDMWKRMQ